MNFNNLFILCLELTGILFFVLLVIILVSRKLKTRGNIALFDTVIVSISCSAFGFLGISIGVSMGLSNSPIVGTIIPAILTFTGAFVSFLLIKTNQEIKKSSQLIAALGLIFLSFFIIKGLESGIESRVLYNETHNEDGSLRDSYYKKLDDTIISDSDKNFLDSISKQHANKANE